MKLRESLGVAEPTQRRLAWLMEVGLVGILVVGFLTGTTGIVVNAGVALLVTQLPPLLQRDYGLPMDAALTLWITAAVFFHALGTVPLPGVDATAYQSIWWWDHLTHALSSSVVAATGYATARALDAHTEEVHLPPRFMFVFVLLFVLAFGVLWEVLEFSIAGVSAAIGGGNVLTQYGLEDTMLDLVFDTAGAIVVALWGTAHLNDVVGVLAARLDARLDRRG